MTNVHSLVERVKSHDLFTEIQPNLWVGGSPAGKLGSHVEFDFIVNLHPWDQYPQGEHQIITTVAMLDRPIVPNPGVLLALADWVNDARKLGKVLVHCQQGWNRSPLVVAIALIRAGMPPAEAIALLREKRSPSVLGNKVFEAFLMEDKIAPR